MEFTSFNLSKIDYDKIKYVVLISEYREKFVVIKNKNKELWELPGGKREESEPLLKTASRELYEETGAIHFKLIPYGVYLMNGSYGMNFYVYIEKMGPLPDYEIEKTQFCSSLPDDLNYGKTYYKMYDKWTGIKEKGKLRYYEINYTEFNNTYCF